MYRGCGANASALSAFVPAKPSTPSVGRLAAGLSAGVRAIGVATGSFTAAELRRAGAELVLGTMEEFPAWYQGLVGADETR